MSVCAYVIDFAGHALLDRIITAFSVLFGRKVGFREEREFRYALVVNQPETNNADYIDYFVELGTNEVEARSRAMRLVKGVNLDRGCAQVKRAMFCEISYAEDLVAP